MLARTQRPAFLGSKISAPSNGVRVSAKLGNWMPGSETPAYLENATGSYGFDPLGLAKEPAALQRYTEAELIHGRWAMAGVAGCLGVEVLGQGSWFDAPLWVRIPRIPIHHHLVCTPAHMQAVNGGTASYFGVPVPFDLATLAVVELVLMAAAESQRGNETDAEKRKYPGGAFDPFGFSKDPATFEQNKIKEIKNGRLAMVAFLGFIGQAYATGKSPLEALAAHLSDPAHNNFAENGVSISFLPNFS